MLSETQKNILQQYATAVATAPIALTSQQDRESFFDRHIADAIALHKVVPPGWLNRPAKVIDVGSGNGVPGLVWAVIEPNWSLTLLDSETKKCLFLDTFCKSYDLKNVQVVLGRAEELARGPLRDTFDIGVARAVGGLSTTLEFLTGFVRPAGTLIVPRGTSEETDSPPVELGRQLGLGLHAAIPYEVPDRRYHALIFPKKVTTPLNIPRRVGIPKKRPL